MDIEPSLELEDQEKILFSHLKEMGASSEIISEFRMQTKAQKKNKSVEILDLDTLVGLEDLNHVFSDESKVLK